VGIPRGGVAGGGLILMTITRLLRLPLAVPRGKWKDLIVVSLVNVGAWHVFSALGLANLPSGRPYWSPIPCRVGLAGRGMAAGRDLDPRWASPSSSAWRASGC
jgi:hypothetical protein